MGNLIAIGIIAIFVIISVRHLIKNKEKGCSLGCEGCSKNCAYKNATINKYKKVNE